MRVVLYIILLNFYRHSFIERLQYYNSKLKKYGKCDTIVFGHILGHEKAFLIQNMCPITPNYIENAYIDKNSKLPVRIERFLEKELIKKAKHILALQRKDIKIIFPDVLSIEANLIMVSNN